MYRVTAARELEICLLNDRTSCKQFWVSNSSIYQEMVFRWSIAKMDPLEIKLAV